MTGGIATFYRGFLQRLDNSGREEPVRGKKHELEKPEPVGEVTECGHMKQCL